MAVIVKKELINDDDLSVCIEIKYALQSEITFIGKEENRDDVYRLMSSAVS